MQAIDANEGHPGRPPRLHQVFASSPLYFVTFGTWDRKPLLANDSVHQAFLLAASSTCAVGNAVGRYVIMPDHVHVFIRIGPTGKLGLAVKCLKEGVTKLLHVNGWGGQVWQPGFFDHLLRSSESYAEKWAYVKANPVRAGLVVNADEWPFQGEVVPVSW
jgi:putative transposase